MKIAIRMPDCSLNVDLPEDKCREVFGLLVRRALGVESGADARGCEPRDPEDRTESPASAEPLEGDNRYWQKYVDKANGAPPEEGEADDVKRYRGFMYLRCSVCGEVHAFCAKQDIAFYRCDKCGKSTLFTDPLKRVYFTCECGRRFTYWTNLTDRMFDITCINCGMPVTVELYEKDGCYRGVKE